MTDEDREKLAEGFHDYCLFEATKKIIVLINKSLKDEALPHDLRNLLVNELKTHKEMIKRLKKKYKGVLND